MDIHKPKPWHGVREFLKEYVIIVVGVLTALGAEQGVEWLHWRHLAEKAEVDLAAGIKPDGTQFVVDVRYADPVNTLVRIYTPTGRLIKTLRQFGGGGQLQIAWDGLDEEGDALANGVYFFRVHINPQDPDGKSSPSQTAETDGRFVIPNR